MRDLLNKLVIGSMVVGAALTVSACGGSESANNTADNTTVTEMDANGAVDGSTNDVGALDAANGSGNMSTDANMTMGTNATTGGNMSGGNMSGGNMSGGNMTNTATGNTTNAM